jgi:hypothetical protein
METAATVTTESETSLTTFADFLSVFLSQFDSVSLFEGFFDEFVTLSATASDLRSLGAEFGDGEASGASKAFSVHGSAADSRSSDAFLASSDPTFLASDSLSDTFLTFSDVTALAFSDDGFGSVVDVGNVSDPSVRSIVPRISNVEVSSTAGVSLGVSLDAFVVFGGSGESNTKFSTLDLDLDVGNLVDGKFVGWVKTVVTRFSGTGSDVESGGSGIEPNTWDSVFEATAVLVGSSNVHDVRPSGFDTSWSELEVDLEVGTDVDVSGSSTLFKGNPFTTIDSSSSALDWLISVAFVVFEDETFFA